MNQYYIFVSRIINAEMFFIMKHFLFFKCSGTLPSVAVGEVNRDACVPGVTSACDKKYRIRVKNCTTFYAYYLIQPDSCPEAYCFGKNNLLKLN